MKKNLFAILLVLLCLSVFAGTFTTMYFLDRNSREETCQYIPSKGWIEEDLEEVFLTTFVVVDSIDEQGDDYIIYNVEANGFKYKVLYTVQRVTDFLNWGWKYLRHTEVGEFHE